MYSSLRYTNIMYTQPYHCNVRIGRDHHRNLCHDAICNAAVLLRRGLVCLECALSLFIRTLDIAIWYIFLLNSCSSSTTTTQLHSCGLWLVIPAAANANVQSDLNRLDFGDIGGSGGSGSLWRQPLIHWGSGWVVLW